MPRARLNHGRSILASIPVISMAVMQLFASRDDNKNRGPRRCDDAPRLRRPSPRRHSQSIAEERKHGQVAAPTELASTEKNKALPRPARGGSGRREPCHNFF